MDLVKIIADYLIGRRFIMWLGEHTESHMLYFNRYDLIQAISDV